MQGKLDPVYHMHLHIASGIGPMSLQIALADYWSLLMTLAGCWPRPVVLVDYFAKAESASGSGTGGTALPSFA